MRPAALVFNPYAGRWRSELLLARVLETLGAGGFDVEPLPTRGPGDAVDQARKASRDGTEVVFALGGDGTLRECAAGLLGSDTALAFLPTGTVNVMALELGIPTNPTAAARAHAQAETLPYGVGLAGDTPFLMQASAGIDAFIIASLRSGEKKLLGRAAGVPAILRSLMRYSFPTFEITTPLGVRIVTLAVAANIRHYGGPWKLTPGARPDGEDLVLFSFSGRGRVAAIRLALSFLLGRHLRIPGTRTERIQRARFAPTSELPFQIDGDILKPTHDRPFEVTLSSHKILMLVPAPRPNGAEGGSLD